MTITNKVANNNATFTVAIDYFSNFPFWVNILKNMKEEPDGKIPKCHPELFYSLPTLSITQP